MERRVFFVLKCILLVVGFFLATNGYHSESGLVMVVFWIVYGIEMSLRSYREEGKVSLGFSLLFLLVGVSILTVGLVKLY
ncbi:hypothetical protein LCM10_05210 [Rossellomorea aquimaris]|uniref:hypothetical protein n=1 Tax=Rossellomorea aquimaris TaxID=189382 RepID=UPI001CD5953A|nr:hypothetical protein [Rossellomorea aquimaris]MCA1054377.1 hypothetical protein [Rossellomorea aquimaris]